MPILMGFKLRGFESSSAPPAAARRQTAFSTSAPVHITSVLLGRRICFIAGTLAKGGAEQQLYYMVRAIQAAGGLPHILCLTQGEFWERQISLLGVPVEFVGHRTNRLARLAAITARLQALKSDLIQSAHFYTNIYAAVAGRILGIPAVGAIRSDLVHEISANGRLLGQASFRFPSKLIANSTAAATTAREMNRAVRIAVLHNCVDTDRFHPLIPVAAPEPPLLLCVGRLIPVKRHDRFIRLVARLKRESQQPFSAILCGGGPLEAELKDLARQNGLPASALQFAGALDDLAPLYRRSSVLVLTSDYEGTPNVVLEAMASGLPVISTDVGGVRDLVQDGQSGYLIPPQDEEALLERTKTVLLDGPLRKKMGASARAFVLGGYSHSSLGGRLAEAYLGLGFWSTVSNLV